METITTTTHETVVVTFNGQDRTLHYQPREQVQALLNRALDAFGVRDSRHVMSLFTTAGAELPDNVSIEQAGVKPGEVLVLRQSTVKGG